MNIQELKALIAKGESPYVEFKEESVRAKDLAAEIVAFANCEGGMILLGVDDGGNVTGIEEEMVEEKIMNICRTSCIPPVVPGFETQEVEGKKVGIIRIEKGIHKPYYTVDNKYYVRVGSTKRIASREELLRLFEKAGSFHFDISPVVGTSVKDLNLERIRDYFLQYNAFDLFEESPESMERVLVNADILTEVEGGVACTLGGLLIFGLRPEKFLPQNGISFAHFKGIELTDTLIDKKNVLGRLPDMAEQIMVILQNNMLRPSVIEGARRVEREEYPLLALREAVVNALVHRNYGIGGSKIRIFMFEDRIEFRSPGRLPNTVSVEKMKVGVSSARNPFLVKYMENLRYIDQLGRGIPMIFSAMKKMGAKEPLLMEQGEEFVLVLYKAGSA